MLTATQAHHPDALKNYIAELKGRIARKDVPYLHIINDFLSDHVVKTDESVIELTSRFEMGSYSEYKLVLPGRSDIGRLNRDSLSVMDSNVQNSAKYPFFGPTANSLRSEFKIFEQRPLRTYRLPMESDKLFASS
jgi:hypothetical protein